MLVSPALFNSDCLSYQIERFCFVGGYFDRAKRTEIASRWRGLVYLCKRALYKQRKKKKEKIFKFPRDMHACDCYSNYCEILDDFAV